MTYLEQYSPQAGWSDGGGLSRRQQVQVQQQATQIVADGILASVRLSVAHYLTMTAMNHVASLAQQGYALADGDRYVAAQLGSLIGCYVDFARQQIQWGGGNR